jgi:hypothetical protein
MTKKWTTEQELMWECYEKLSNKWPKYDQFDRAFEYGCLLADGVPTAMPASIDEEDVEFGLIAEEARIMRLQVRDKMDDVVEIWYRNRLM